MSKRQATPARPPFIELEPEIIPAPEATIKHTWLTTDDRAAVAHLPAQGDGVLEATVVGPRLRLTPRDRIAAARLGAMDAQSGRYYDRLTSGYVGRLGEHLRRGTARLDSLTCFAALVGAPLRVSPAAEVAAAHYRRSLSLQLAPIPRVVWRDEREDEGRVIAEVDMRDGRRELRGDEHRIN